MKPWISAAVVGMLPLSLLQAQEPTDTIELNPVVVTATRIPTPIRDLPAAVTVIDGAELREHGIRTVADALRTVPAANVVATNAYGGQTSLFLRGGEADYVKVLIDGVPQNSPGGAYDFGNLTTDNVERIEVVRGPVSVLYGSDAVTGVVQIFTRNGGGRGRASVDAAAGTYGSNRFETTVEGGGERAGYAFSVSRFASDGVDSVDNQYRNHVVTGRVWLRPDDRTDGALSLRYGDALYHFPTDGSGAIVSNNQHQLDRGPSVALDLGRNVSARVAARVTADWHRDNYQYAIAPNDSSDHTTFPYSSSDWVTRAGVDARANLRVSAGNVLTLGTALERENVEGTTLDTVRSRNNGAVYLQLVRLLERPMSYTLGARLEDNERFGAYVTYRAGVSFRLREHTRAFGSIGTGFKEPTFYENFATGFVHGNPDLRPEHSFSWETGLEQSVLRDAVTVRATYFHQRFRDLIDYNGADAATNYFNVPGANASGIEFATEAIVGERIHLTAGYTFLDTRVTKAGVDSGPTGLFLPGEALIRRPRNAGALGVAYRLAMRGSVALTALYMGEREDVDYATFQRVTLPAHTRVDAALNYEVVRRGGSAPGLALSVRIENVFDQAYEEIKNFPARGRTILIGARLRFGY
jgi:vitamin B12 transporter